MAVPVYGSLFVYGAASAPDKVRLSGPTSSSPVGNDPWYGDSPLTDKNGNPYAGVDYGLPVDQWNEDPPGSGYVGYPAGPVGPTWVPNESWLYGVDLPAGTYTRIAKPHWSR